MSQLGIHGPRKLIPNNYPRDIPYMKIIPLGDIHYGNPSQNKRLLQETIDEIENSPHTYWIGMGDYTEQNGKRQPHGGVFKDTLTPEEQIDAFIKDFRPIADKCLGFIGGNHDYRPTKEFDVDPLKLIAVELSLKHLYVTDGALIEVAFGNITRKGGRREPGGGKHCIYRLYCTHGATSGTTMSSKLLNMEKMEVVQEADVYIGAHTHSQLVFSKRIYTEEGKNGQLHWRDRYFINTGSFLDYDGYAMSNRYPPSVPGAPKILLAGDRELVKVTI